MSNDSFTALALIVVSLTLLVVTAHLLNHIDD